eukprot:517548-Rhodomonas_salina.2
MKNPRLCPGPFWIKSQNKEIKGLWDKGCFKRWKHSELLNDDWVFGSLFHYHIKRDSATGHVTNCKARLVVMGNRMKEGKDYEDAFAPVLHATSARVIISLAAADDLELHSCYLAQAFIQADKLDEGVNGQVFITLPKGSNEEPDTVFKVLLQLYEIQSRARALHLTLTKWFKSQGFATAGFEDSIWVRKAGGEYEDCLIVSAHINDSLMACKSLATLEKFKAEFLTRFEGTDEGKVSTYLGAELIRDRINRTITFKQSVNVQKILQTYGAWDKPSVKTQLEAGVRLTKEDSPTF